MQRQYFSKYNLNILFLIGYIAAFGLLFHDVLAKLVQDWATDDNYSHGFLIVPFLEETTRLQTGRNNMTKSLIFI